MPPKQAIPAKPAIRKSPRKKDGLDAAKKKKKYPTKKQSRLPDDEKPRSVALSIEDGIERKNPRKVEPTESVVREVAKEVVGSLPKNADKEERDEHATKVAGVRKLITGQAKAPHHYAMLGARYNDEGERTSHRLEWYRRAPEKGHLPSQEIKLGMQLPPTSSERRDQIYRRYMGIGQDRRIFTPAQLRAYERNFDRPYNHWPYSAAVQNGRALKWTPTEKQEAAYEKRTGKDWEPYDERDKPAKYTNPRGF